MFRRRPALRSSLFPPPTRFHCPPVRARNPDGTEKTGDKFKLVMKRKRKEKTETRPNLTYRINLWSGWDVIKLFQRDPIPCPLIRAGNPDRGKKLDPLKHPLIK